MGKRTSEVQQENTWKIKGILVKSRKHGKFRNKIWEVEEKHGKLRKYYRKLRTNLGVEDKNMRSRRKK